MQVNKNKIEVIGDIRPIGTSPNFLGLVVKISSISHVKLKIYSRRIKRQNNAARSTTKFVIDRLTTVFLKLYFKIRRLANVKNRNAVEGAIGMNFNETDAIITLQKNQPIKLRQAIKSTK